MSTPSGFTWVRCPARLADLAFRFVRPDDWVEAELPVEEVDFTDPMKCAPLAVCHASYAALVFSVGARPAYADGTVAQWLDYLLREQGLVPGPIELEQLRSHRAAATWVTSLESGTPVRQRIAAFEDGGRLLLLGALAPRDLWTAAEANFAAMLHSFELERPQGPTTELAPEEVPLAASSFFALQRIAGESSQAPATAQPSPAELEPSESSFAAAPPSASDEERADVEVSDVSPAEPDALDPEHPMNQRLRDAGVGLVPRVLERDETSGTAKLGVGSLCAFVHLPTGWHALDDGRRLLVFDGPGGTQINVRRFAREGQDDEAILQARLGAAYQSWPTLEHLRIELEGLPCLGLRNFEVEGEKVEQVYLLRSINAEELLEARVTSTPSSIGDALDVAHPLLLRAEVLPAA